MLILIKLQVLELIRKKCPIYIIKLVIELDWEIHNNPDKKEYDSLRDEIISNYWVKILRLMQNPMAKIASHKSFDKKIELQYFYFCHRFACIRSGVERIKT
mgnify:CR=1 FL=1